MADRRRRFPFFRGRGSIEAVNPDLATDYKALASLSTIGSSTTVDRRTGSKSQGAPTRVSYSILREISMKSEVIAAILRRTVDDVLGNGYRFDLADGVDKGNQADRDRLNLFFSMPNPEDMGDEWLETLVYDLCLFGDAYLELDGSADKSSNEGQDWSFGGKLSSIWNVPADTIEILPHARLPPPPEMAYIQQLNGDTRRFSSDKILHISKYKQGRGYGTSPLIPLMQTIAGQLNLSNYINEMFTGTLPKTILNVGDISNSEMKTMLAMLEQQLSGGKSPFGLVAVNGGSGFQTHRLIDSVKDGQHLDLLYYYREEICAVFGIPPMKLGWVQTGKLSNPESQLEAWYDVVESYHHRIQSLVNNRILPMLGVSDFVFVFNTIRPSKEQAMAEVIRSQGAAIAALRQEGVISVNEARKMLGYDLLDEDEATDPFYLSPKLAINRGAGQPEPDTPSEPSEEPPVAEEEPEGSDTAQEDKSDRTGSKMWF
jgi:phage portal protein BeeE